MKKLITSFASATAGQPIPAETLGFLVNALTNASKILALGQYKLTYNTNDIVILYGCENNGSGLNYIISAGAVLYNGEVYEVDAITFTAAGGQVACATTIDTYEAFDPLTFTDSSTHSVHQTRKITFVPGPAGGSGVTNYIGDFSAFISTGKIIYPLAATKATQNTGAASTSYTVQFDTVVYDAGTILNTGTGVFTPKKGWQKLTAQLTCQPNSSYTGAISIQIYKNGSLFDSVAADYWAGTEAKTLQIVNYPLNCNGTDTYKIVTASSSTQYDVNSAQLYLEPISSQYRM